LRGCLEIVQVKRYFLSDINTSETREKRGERKRERTKLFRRKFVFE
jgi:hypothetical protein